MGTRPQTLAALADSPIGLATFLLDHDARSLEMIARSFDGQPEGKQAIKSLVHLKVPPCPDLFGLSENILTSLQPVCQSGRVLNG